MTRTKNFRVKAVVVGAALTLLLGAGAASASHGADDAVGHVRNSSDDKAKASGGVRNSSDDKAKANMKLRKDLAKAAARVQDSITKTKASGQVRSSDDGVGHVRHSGVHAVGHR